MLPKVNGKTINDSIEAKFAAVKRFIQQLVLTEHLIGQEAFLEC